MEYCPLKARAFKMIATGGKQVQEMKLTSKPLIYSHMQKFFLADVKRPPMRFAEQSTVLLFVTLQAFLNVDLMVKDLSSLVVVNSWGITLSACRVHRQAG